METHLAAGCFIDAQKKECYEKILKKYVLWETFFAL